MASPGDPQSTSSPQKWRQVKASQLPEGLELFADGSVRCGGQLLPSHVGLHNVSLDGLMLSKSPGPQVRLQVASEDGEYRYRFTEGKWYEPATTVQSTEPPPLDVEPGRPVGPIPFGFLVRRYWKWGMVALTVLIVTAVTLKIRKMSERKLSDAIGSAKDDILQAVQSTEITTREELDAVSQELDRTLAQVTGLKSDFSAHRDQLVKEKSVQQQRTPVDGPGDSAHVNLLTDEFRNTQAKLARLKSEFAELQLRIAEEESLRGAQLARDRYLEAQRQANELLRSQDELATEVKAWHDTIRPLFTNDTGRKLASQEEAVRFFVAEYEKQRSSPESIAAMRPEIEELARFIERTLVSGPVSPPTDLTERLSAKRAEIDAILTSYRDSRRQILALIERIAGPASVTLEQAIQRLALVDAEERAGAVAAKVEDVNRRRNELQAERAREAAEGRLAREAEQAEHEANLAEAKSSKVRASLQLFFTPGFLQPSVNGVERTTTKKPISLSGLQAVGALQDSTQGLQKLYFVVCHDQDKDRPRWGTESNVEFIDRKEFERLQTAQGYLRRLGDALVELKLLSP